ncbi:MAG: hypothetical protein AABW63_00060 [Nanoarchaeota archaeon]
MKQKRVSFTYKKKKISLEVKECRGLMMGVGLTWKRRQNAHALLFDFGKDTDAALTALFVFFPFVAIWLDKNGKVVEKRVIKPFEFSIKPKKNFVKVIEIPLNDKYKKEAKVLVGKERFKN